MVPVDYPVSDPISHRTVLRLARQAGASDVRLLIVLARADTSSTRHPRTEFLNVLDTMVVDALKDRPEEMASPLSGDEIMGRFGLSPSAEIGEIKAHLLGLVIDGTLGRYDKDAAIVAAAHFIAARRGATPDPG
jgi:hypothetical protein